MLKKMFLSFIEINLLMMVDFVGVNNVATKITKSTNIQRNSRQNAKE